MDDAELVDRARSGDAGAFEELVARHHGACLRYAGHLLPAILFFPSRKECDVAARELSVLRAPGSEDRARALGVWETETADCASPGTGTALIWPAGHDW